MKENSYKHFIITRFNLVFKVFKEDKSGNKTHTDEWLEKRFELFDWFCFPSIANQTNNKFIWMVLFSYGTPDYYKEKIDKYRQAFPGFVPLYLKDDEVMLDRLKKEISKSLTANESHIITTRIDNDDSFHKDITSLIQQQFAGQEDQYMNFNKGLQYDMDNGVLCQLSYKNNAFISRIESVKNGDFKTVLEKRHDTGYKKGDMKYIETYPAWLQIIHEGNVSNSLRISKLFFSPTVLEDFNVKAPVEISTFNSIKLYLKYNQFFFKFSKIVSKGKSYFKKKKNTK